MHTDRIEKSYKIVQENETNQTHRDHRRTGSNDGEVIHLVVKHHQYTSQDNISKVLLPMYAHKLEPKSQGGCNINAQCMGPSNDHSHKSQ